MAAYFANKEMVELLLDRGANIDGAGGKLLPLYLAGKKGKKVIVDVLVERGTVTHVEEEC